MKIWHKLNCKEYWASENCLRKPDTHLKIQWVPKYLRSPLSYYPPWKLTSGVNSLQGVVDLRATAVLAGGQVLEQPSCSEGVFVFDDAWRKYEIPSAVQRTEWGQLIKTKNSRPFPSIPIQHKQSSLFISVKESSDGFWTLWDGRRRSQSETWR